MQIKKPLRQYAASYPQDATIKQYYADCNNGNSGSCESCNTCNECSNQTFNGCADKFWE